MSEADRDSRIEAELTRQLELSPIERADAMRVLTREDRELASRVESWARWLSERRLAAAEVIPERLGEFRLIRRLSGGGMGVVWLAAQELLGREVALKVLRPDLGWFDEARARFRREADSVAPLRHPNLGWWTPQSRKPRHSSSTKRGSVRVGSRAMSPRKLFRYCLRTMSHAVFWLATAIARACALPPSRSFHMQVYVGRALTVSGHLGDLDNARENAD